MRKETESLKSGGPVHTYSGLPGLDKVDVKEQEVFAKDMNKLFDLRQKSDYSILYLHICLTCLSVVFKIHGYYFV